MRRISTFVLALTLAAAGTVVSAQQPRTIKMIGRDNLTFSLPTITARPGEKLTVVLRTMSLQPATQLAHNFVLLKQGANPSKYAMLAAMAKDHGYLPPTMKDQVLVSTGLAAAGETVQATFTAPKTPGSYPYVCSFPGHLNGGMKGTLVVK
jgi:azurin